MIGRMTDWKRKKLWLEQETGQVYTRLKNTSTTLKTIKTTAGRKKIKNNGICNTYDGPLSQEQIDGRYWSSLWYVMLTKVMSKT